MSNRTKIGYRIQAIPVCCDEEMPVVFDPDEGLKYSCPTCSRKLSIKTVREQERCFDAILLQIGGCDIVQKARRTNH
jgi:hypothetical protein